MQYRSIQSSLILILATYAFSNSLCQSNILGHEELASWNQIKNTSISANGDFITYEIRPNEGDPMVCLYSAATAQSKFFERGSDPKFTYDGSHLLFRVAPPEDSLRAMRRRKVKKEDLPGDTLFIVSTRTGEYQSIPGIETYSMPERSGGYLAFTVKTPPNAIEKADSATVTAKDTSKIRNEENGYTLVVMDLEGSRRDTLDYVTGFGLARDGFMVAAVSTGDDNALKAGVYAMEDFESGWLQIKTASAKYDKLAIDNAGSGVAFTVDTDTTKAEIRHLEIHYWTTGLDSAHAVVDGNDEFLPNDWIVSGHADLLFSKDGNRLFFGISPEPLLQDTNLLEEEVVDVEVWHYLDQRVYTQQNILLESERKRSYLSVVDLNTFAKQLIGDTEWSEYEFGPERNSDYVLLYREKPYLMALSWDGFIRKDIAVHDLRTGARKVLARGVHGNPALSPLSKYAWWYNRSDSLWHVHNLETGQALSFDLPLPAYDELNDQPAEPYEYGAVGWTKDDEQLLVYDRYDIWSIRPDEEVHFFRLTNGRTKNLVYRLIDLDPELTEIDSSEPFLLHVFDDRNKSSGYTRYHWQDGKWEDLVFGPRQYTKRVIKARNSEQLVFTRESFEEFPDLRLTSDWFATDTRVSQVNPQQAEYLWGSAEQFEWTAFDGKELQGILVKPANFDPTMKYPMLVNFYERSSDELYEHKTPFPHRSTINYSFYASRGYVIFNPDVVYDVGHPGASAYNCVVSGVEEVLKMGFVDPGRIGVQGHSWGGYQVADLITRTDIFKCAEAGAPLVNMINAYGGIRWQTGLSRMFQYEQTQSRLGVTPWEDIDLYIENSPWFNLDKVNTPVLIMHNDKDGHVPWHLGIEYFVAMRRLGKPAWMLNYTGEPHWPLKVQNRKDFNIRLQQFFDHFLMGAPQPEWMRDGVPATEKGIEQGYELIED